MNNLEKHVLRLIQEDVDNPDVFLDTPEGIAPIRDSINDGIQEICMVTGSYRRTYHLPLYEDRQFYRLGFEADHFGWVMEAWDRDRTQSLQMTDLHTLMVKDVWWMRRTGTPEMYFQIGENILGIYYKPSSSGTVLELDCICIPKRYNADGDRINVRNEYQRATVYLAVSEYYASRGDATRAGENLQKYIETAGLDAMHPNYSERYYQFGNQFRERNQAKLRRW